MKSVTPFLTFINQAEEAARLYTSIFPNSRIKQITHYPDLGPNTPFKSGSVMTVEFVLDGREFVALNGGPSFAFSKGFSVSVLCDTQQEIDRYWNALLADGGTPQACGWLSDKFGLSWQITPTILMNALSNPDPAKVQRAMQAMITMVKIEIEPIKRALQD